MLFNREHQMGIKGLPAERRISYKIPFSHNDVYGSDDSCRKVFVFSSKVFYSRHPKKPKYESI